MYIGPQLLTETARFEARMAERKRFAEAKVAKRAHLQFIIDEANRRIDEVDSILAERRRIMEQGSLVEKLTYSTLKADVVSNAGTIQRTWTFFAMMTEMGPSFEEISRELDKSVANAGKLEREYGRKGLVAAWEEARNWFRAEVAKRKGA